MEQQNNGLTAIKQYLSSNAVSEKFKELLGKRSVGFITSVMQIISQNKNLSNADPASVYQAAAIAATLDLPLNNNLGFAYIVPYNEKGNDGVSRQVAQFQMGYRGFIQLAQRSGQFSTINVSDVREGEIKSHNRLTGEITFEWNTAADRSKKALAGFVAYFRLINGFEKCFFMTTTELKEHGKRYSKTFSHASGRWNVDFEAMAAKTVIKFILSKYAPLSVDMQTAILTDQSKINDAATLDVEYVDHDEPEIDKEAERIALMIEDAKSIDELNQLRDHVQPDQMSLFDNKMQILATI